IDPAAIKPGQTGVLEFSVSEDEQTAGVWALALPASAAGEATASGIHTARAGSKASEPSCGRCPRLKRERRQEILYVRWMYKSLDVYAQCVYAHPTESGGASHG